MSGPGCEEEDEEYGKRCALCNGIVRDDCVIEMNGKRLEVCRYCWRDFMERTAS